MRSGLLSGMVAEGILTKKERILFFHGSTGNGASWLKRRGFRVETMSRSPGSSTGVRYETVLAETASGMIASSREHLDFLREALIYVRPAGRLLICYTNDSLFDSASSDEVLARLSSCVPADYGKVVPLPVLSNPSEMLFSIKKGGAYIPRLPVEYIDEFAGFAQACEKLGTEPYIGLDVETTLVEPRILCTVQLATEARIYVMDMLPMKDLRPLKQLMENASITKIIHNKDFESAVLGQYGVRICTVYDTLVESRKRFRSKGGGGNKLGEVCERELGIYLDKSYQASDWTVRPLTPEQLNYAAADAEVLIRLYHLFRPTAPPVNLELF